MVDLIQKSGLAPGMHPGRWWHAEGDRLECDLCPRRCMLKEGDRGFCFVRQNVGGEMMLTTYGKSTGFCIDPIEKKPLNHFYPGTSVLSFGTAGCNLGCKFCQNWDISKSREIERLSELALPEDIARAAQRLACRSVAFTYNDPVIWAEYAIDAAHACHARGIKTVAVTAGYITEEARGDFYEVMDAANVDLKAFSEEFYHRLTLSHLEPVLDTLRWLKRETDVWFEITNLIIPDANDTSDEFQRMCDWILENVGDETPVHFTAFHPDFRMTDRPRTPQETLNDARDIAIRAGLKFAYTGNVDDVRRQSTYCPECKKLLIERNWHLLGEYALDGNRCRHCGCEIPGRFADEPGNWGRRRLPVDMRRFASPPASEKTADRETPALQARIEMPLVESTSRLSAAEEDALLRTTANHVVAATYGKSPTAEHVDLAELGNREVLGVYVSLKRNGHLRGCRGYFGRPTSLASILGRTAADTTLRDPRFPPVSPTELPYLDLEVWLLHSGQELQEAGEARANAITIGRHGLHITRGNARGLLLPGVATGNNWDATEFLNQVCIKAKLIPTAWKEDDASIIRFEGDVFRRKLLLDADGARLPFPARKVAPDELLSISYFCKEAIRELLRGENAALRIEIGEQSVNGVALTASIPGSGAEVTRFRTRLIGDIPLRDTIHALCNEIATILRKNRVLDFDLDVAVMHDPAVHGSCANPDLNGIDQQNRCLWIGERSKFSCVYDLAATPDALLSRAADLAQVLEPEAARIFSLHIQSTRPQLHYHICPQPVSGERTRPPSVAGKFYPSDEREVSATLDRLLAGDTVRQHWSAVMVPHAGWRFSGKIAADVLKRVEFPKTVIALGPKHTPHGVDWAVAPHGIWDLPGMAVESDPELAKKLADAVPALQLDAAAHREEHAIEVELPFIARLAPGTRVVGVAVGCGNLERCGQFAQGLAQVMREMNETPLLLISTDMNHFANDAETRRLDALALAQLERKDPDALFKTVRENHISMCGVLPAVIALKALRLLHGLNDAELVGYGTSADVTGDKSRVVGYAGMLFR